MLTQFIYNIITNILKAKIPSITKKYEFKSFSLVAKSINDQNGDQITCVAKTLLAKSLATEFHFCR